MISDGQPTAICGLCSFCQSTTTASRNATHEANTPASETKRSGTMEKLVAICSQSEIDLLRLYPERPSLRAWCWPVMVAMRLGLVLCTSSPSR
ncbi:hypothetical protein D3C80_1825580 [compost metagenome]